MKTINEPIKQTSFKTKTIQLEMFKSNETCYPTSYFICISESFERQRALFKHKNPSFSMYTMNLSMTALISMS